MFLCVWLMVDGIGEWSVSVLCIASGQFQLTLAPSGVGHNIPEAAADWLARNASKFLERHGNSGSVGGPGSVEAALAARTRQMFAQQNLAASFPTPATLPRGVNPRNAPNNKSHSKSPPVPRFNSAKNTSNAE